MFYSVYVIRVFSESEGGISDAPTAVVSDTEGHGQVLANTKPVSRLHNPTLSPGMCKL